MSRTLRATGTCTTSRRTVRPLLRCSSARCTWLFPEGCKPSHTSHCFHIICPAVSLSLRFCLSEIHCLSPGDCVHHRLHHYHRCLEGRLPQRRWGFTPLCGLAPKPLPLLKKISSRWSSYSGSGGWGPLGQTTATTIQQCGIKN